MNKSIFRSFCIVLIISIAIFSTAMFIILSNQMIENTKQEILYSLKLINYHVQRAENILLEIEGISDIVHLDNMILTIIDSDGYVIVDSEQDSVENYSQREEVQEALENEVGSSISYSTTSKQRLLYVAYYQRDYIIRIAIPYKGLFNNVIMLISPLLVSVVISLGIAAIVAKKLSEKLSKPAREISRQVRHMNQRQAMQFDVYPIDEYNIVTNALLSQEQVIEDMVNRLQLEKMKVANIIDQMKEGFILLDLNLDILMVNQTAKEIINKNMKVKMTIKEYLFNNEILQALQETNVNEHQVDFNKVGKIYRCLITKAEFGITLLFVDVTESRNIATMRQQFFSNISHELKTPMTAIKGYSELLETGIIEDTHIKKEALRKIQKEVTHMSTLINDILTVSRLETKDIKVERIPVNIKAQLNEALDSLMLEANNKNIIIYTYCEDIVYDCDYQHMHQLLNNLLSNAIKYNKDGGQVNIKVKDSLNMLKISVSDTGIGIPNSEKDRVFERFYRCDKARSRSIGGTGLGLSIVKHIVQYYKGSIQLISDLDKGTTIFIQLPKNTE